MAKWWHPALLAAAVLWAAPARGAQSAYDAGARRWTLDNKWIRAEFELTGEGYFRTARLKDSKSGDEWLPPRNSPTSIIRFQVEEDWFDHQMPFELVEQYATPIAPSGVRQVIVLRDLNSRGDLTVHLELYDGQPVLRYSLKYSNRTPAPVHVKLGNMLSWSFGDRGKRFTALRVNQWSLIAKPQNFEPAPSAVDPSGRAIEVYSGAHGEQCGWMAVRDSDNRGLFAGWEFDGRARATVRHSAADGRLEFTANIVDLYHPVAPGEEFLMPPAFVGLYHGDWDEAGYRTQRFAEAVLAKAPAEPDAFPYVAWDSWSYQTAIDEVKLRREAEAAASLGVELFIVDLGWARAIGDWHSDRDKFPSGLKSLSDYVHALGMRFGLHFALTEADPKSPVLKEHPAWVSTEDNDYHGADSLCLSHQPVKEWLIAEGIRIIDEYGVDWLLQDGENMVKSCTRSDHTHDPRDSNYANSVEGLNAVVSAIQQARPDTMWENCENGGNMMTFNMVRNYVTSITNDASGSFSSRKAVYGATYPFPPRYADRYMPDEGLSPYVTHSYLFGGPWVIMRPLTDLSGGDRFFLEGEVRAYKAKRRTISGGKVFHIAAPATGRVDALQSYHAEKDEAIAIVSREKAAASAFLLKPRGLTSSQRYRVWFDGDSRSYSQTGAQLMREGVSVALPSALSSEVVHFERQQ